jgi:hypothetical protein
VTAFEPRSRRPRPSSTNTTTADHTAACHTEQHRQRSMTQCPKHYPATPATPTPTTASDTTSSTPPAVVTLRIAGRLHHIGIGRTHARTHIIMLICDLHVRIVNATTGELLRELTINPDRDYQPRNQKAPNPLPQVRDFPIS